MDCDSAVNMMMHYYIYWAEVGVNVWPNKTAATQGGRVIPPRYNGRLCWFMVQWTALQDFQGRMRCCKLATNQHKYHRCIQVTRHCKTVSRWHVLSHRCSLGRSRNGPILQDQGRRCSCPHRWEGPSRPLPALCLARSLLRQPTNAASSVG
jgi:hypothetical protein